MLTFARSFVRQLRVLFHRTLDLPNRLLHYPVRFSAGPQGLIIRTHSALYAAEYRETTPQPPCELVASLALLKGAEGLKTDPVTLVTNDDGLVTARWLEARIPRALSDESPPINPQIEFPAFPSEWSENSPDLWPALAAARDTTDALATRYAFGCIQLRGKPGAIAATDGSQLFRQTGFQFGWEDEVLIPGSKLFTAPELPRGQPMAVGRLEKTIVLRSDKWTFWLPIQEGRFPRVDDTIPAPSSTHTTLCLPPAQQDFLRQNLSRLKCDGPYEPVTIDLNGRVAFRSRENAATPPAELALSRASYAGPEMSVVSNRRYLQRALDLGFSEISLISPNAALVCRESNRTYVWMSVSPDYAVKATAETVVIESPDSVMITHSRRQRTVPITVPDSVSIPLPSGESSTPMPQTTPPTTETAAAAAPAVRRKSTCPASKASLIEQAQTVRTKLRELLTETNDLLRAAKRQRQQERLVRSTLASLKQLQQAG